MAFPRASEAATAFFEELLATVPDARSKPMFGNLAGFLCDHMFLGVFGDEVLVRLAEPDRAALLKLPGTAIFEPIAGRPMREYVLMPAAWREQPGAAREWVARSASWVATLPAKPPKAPKVAKAKKPG